MFTNSISFVIPTYNEEANIKKIIDTAFSFLSSNFNDFEIIVVDDGSIDKTQLICEELISLYKEKLIILRHLKNRGYGAALRTGLFSAKKKLVFYTDADNQFDITEIKDFMNCINDFDLVIGYRKNRKDVAIRKLCASVFNRMIFVLFGLDVKDIDCSFKLFKNDSLKRLSIERDEFFVDTELLIKAKNNKLKIKELPVSHFPRMAGKSSVKPYHVFSTLRDIFILYQKLKLKKPINI